MATEPVTVAIVRRVRPGCEAAFESALHEFIERSLHEPGQMGVYVLRPAPGVGSREYGILRRFDSAEARDAFYRSGLFAEWQKQAAPLSEGEPSYEHITGLETWFTLPGRRSIVPPPAWKMALVTVLGVWPVSMLVPLLLDPLIYGMHPALKALLVAVGIVILLTWAIMPILARILRRFLYQHREVIEDERPGTDTI
jgi:antibiotic biosynthesis monooxygenase (ABM) superfamily enzyme